MELRFGIESELFLITKHGNCPSLERMQNFFNCIAAFDACSLLIHPPTGCVWNSTRGTVHIWNDFSTNILEIAYPPVVCPSHFLELHAGVQSMLSRVLPTNGLSVVSGSVASHAFSEIVLRPAPTAEYQSRLDLDLKREHNGRKLFDTCFYANICSTQVSLSLSAEQWTQLVHAMYEFEFLIPLLFSQPTTLHEETLHCFRHFIVHENWPDDPFVGFPPDLQMLVDASQLDAKPRTYKFANCVLRDDERVEFRSCDRVDDPELILEMVCLRILTTIAAHTFGPSGNEPVYRDAFFSACRNDEYEKGLVSGQYEKLKTAAVELPAEWNRSCQRLLDRIAKLL